MGLLSRKYAWQIGRREQSVLSHRLFPRCLKTYVGLHAMKIHASTEIDCTVTDPILNLAVKDTKYLADFGIVD